MLAAAAGMSQRKRGERPGPSCPMDPENGLNQNGFTEIARHG